MQLYGHPFNFPDAGKNILILLDHVSYDLP